MNHLCYYTNTFQVTALLSLNTEFDAFLLCSIHCIYCVVSEKPCFKEIFNIIYFNYAFLLYEYNNQVHSLKSMVSAFGAFDKCGDFHMVGLMSFPRESKKLRHLFYYVRTV